jgi:hypothetical protein
VAQREEGREPVKEETDIHGAASGASGLFVPALGDGRVV